VSDVPVAADYAAALTKLLLKVQSALGGTHGSAGEPVRMVLAGGAALAWHTGARVTEDVDATFSRRVLLAEDIEVAYRDADGAARVLYLDRNYNDTLGLMHEDAYDDSMPIRAEGIDPARLQVRVLTPIDLAVSKISRLSDQDREDIVLLARSGLIDAAGVRRRALEALGGHVGNMETVRNSIDIACRLIEANVPPRPLSRPRRR
jgi:hypothetical protein